MVIRMTAYEASKHKRKDKPTDLQPCMKGRHAPTCGENLARVCCVGSRQHRCDLHRCGPVVGCRCQQEPMW